MQRTLHLSNASAYLPDTGESLLAFLLHHQYIGGFLLLGAFAHGGIYLARDVSSSGQMPTLLRTLLRYQAAVLSHLSALTLFLGFHTLGLYVHNDAMTAFGSPESLIAV